MHLEDESDPIAFRYGEENVICLSYPSPASYNFALQGDGGPYVVVSDNPYIVRAKMILSFDLRLTPLAIGNAVLAVRDKSGNVMTIDVCVDYIGMNSIIH